MYCIKCGNKIDGCEWDSNLDITKYKCIKCNDEWMKEDHIDHNTWLIEKYHVLEARIDVLEKEFGL